MTSLASPELVLGDFVGVWQRQSIAVAGRDPFEDSHVFWLQAGEYFADIRWPKRDDSHAKVSALAGTVKWDSPVMHFHHEIDLTKEFLEDAGTMFFENEQLHEKGKVSFQGREIEFEEIWMPLVRAGPSNCQVARRVDRSGFIVRVGGYAMVLQEGDSEFCCACWHDAAGVDDWSLLFSLGEITELTVAWQASKSGSVHENWQILL